MSRNDYQVTRKMQHKNNLKSLDVGHCEFVVKGHHLIISVEEMDKKIDVEKLSKKEIEEIIAERDKLKIENEELSRNVKKYQNKLQWIMKEISGIINEPVKKE